MKSKGVEFDLLFDPDIMGDGPTAPGYKVGGVALRYAALKYGTKRANVGYAEAGVDLSNKWAAKGTAVYSLPFNDQTFSAYSSGNVSSNMLASITTKINADGTYSVECVGNNLATTAEAGTWLPSGQAASDYQVQFSVATVSTRPSGGATIVNGASVYSACTSNRQVQASASVGQLSAQDKGGKYEITIRLKRVSTGLIQSTVHVYDISSAGTG